jgi:hypothetical protein
MSKKKRFVKREQRGDQSKNEHHQLRQTGTGTDHRNGLPRNLVRQRRRSLHQPIDRLALAQLINLNGQHGGIIHARKNMVTADYQGGGLTFDELEAAVFDYLTFGDMAVAKIRNGWGDVIGLQPLPGFTCAAEKKQKTRKLCQGLRGFAGRRAAGVPA